MTVNRSAIVQEIMDKEPEMENLLATARGLMLSREQNHWQKYEACKKLFNDFVGFNARNPELRTEAHYIGFLSFIEGLIPEDTRVKQEAIPEPDYLPYDEYGDEFDDTPGEIA